VSVGIQQVHHPGGGPTRLGHCRLPDFYPRPAEIVADFIGDINQTADDSERSVRRVDDAANEMWMPEYCHATPHGKRSTASCS
jgi:hypothetical protein